MKPRKLNKGYRLAPELVARMQAAADRQNLRETDIVTLALVEYLTRFERTQKRESANG